MKREIISMKVPDPKTSARLSDLEAATSVATENGEVMAGEQKSWQDFRKGATQALTRTVASLRLLWESRRFLGGIAGAGLLLSTLIAFLIPNRYESYARLMPPDNPPGLTQAVLALAGGTAGLGTIASQLLAQRNTSELLAGVLSSRTMADTLIQKFDLRRVYRERRIEDTRKELAAHTGIVVDRKDQIITIAVNDKSPQRAAAMVQTYVEELNRTVAEVSTSSARRERVFLEGRLQAVKQDLEAAEKEFSQFLSKNTALDIKEPGKALVGAPAVLQGQYLAARAELEGLRQHYPDSNVRVRSLQARVAELENQLATVGGKDESASLGKATQDGALYPWIRNLPLLGVTYADLYRRTRIQEMLFDTLTQEYELAKAQEAKAIPTVKVLDPPSIPEKKSYPPRLLFMLLGTVLALAGGVAWLFGGRAWEQTDPSNPGKVLAQEVFDTVKAAMPWTSRNRFWRRRSSGKTGGHVDPPDIENEKGK
jgi:capsule polysaccharide export protein KpsE/RkpR